MSEYVSTERLERDVMKVERIALKRIACRHGYFLLADIVRAAMTISTTED